MLDRRRSFAAAVVGCLLCIGANAQAQEWGFQVRLVADNLNVPWSILWGPDGWLWCTERPGRISRIHPETGAQSVLLAAVPDLYARTEAGLLGMALHRRFTDSPFVAVAYTVFSDFVELRVVRYRYDAARDTLLEPRTLLAGIRVGNIHAGCRLLPLPDGTLLLTVGEGGIPQLAQDLNSLSGKALRIRWDGTPPADNPFPGSPLWAWGLRNSQGLTLGSEGLLYASEHGASTDDEINLLEPGRNYGWPLVEGVCDKPQEQDFCRDSNVAEPLYTWTPTVAPCGLAYYGRALTRLPQFQHSLLLATLKGNTLYQLRLSADGRRIESVRPYAVGLGRLRDVLVTPDGRVFLCTSNRDGRGTPRPGDDRIVELVPLGQHIDGGELPEGWGRLWIEDGRLWVQLDTPADVAIFTVCGELLAFGSAALPLQRWCTPVLAPGWYGVRVARGQKRHYGAIIVPP